MPARSRWNTRMTRRELLRYGAGAASAAAVAAGSAAPLFAAPVPRRGGTLVYASSADVITLDPPYVSDTVSAAVLSMLYDHLVAFTPALRLRPDLALRWTASGNTWTFRLRPGVRFADGTACDAAAVKAHFDRLLGPEKPLRANLWVPYVDHVDAPDPYTVRFTSKFTDPLLPVRLADSTGAIESPAAFKKYGKDLARHPVGTGPFTFGEWVSGQRIVVSRNDGYWGDKAYLDEVIIRPVPDALARVIALTAGDVQLAIDVPPEQIPRITADPALQIQTRETLRYLFAGMNVLKKPFSDLRVRQALNHAVDRASIVKNLYQGMAVVLNGGIPEGAAGYAPIPGFAYDPAGAKRLLAEAGYPNGFSTTMVGPKGRYLNDFELQQAIQQQLGAVGVKVELDTVEWARYLELLRTAPATSPLEMWLDAWADVDAAAIIGGRFGCASFRPHGANTAGFCDQAIDRLVTQAQRTLNDAARALLLKRAQELLAEQAPAVWLLQVKEAAGASRRLHDPVLMETSVVTVDEHTWLGA